MRGKPYGQSVFRLGGIGMAALVAVLLVPAPVSGQVDKVLEEELGDSVDQLNSLRDMAKQAARAGRSGAKMAGPLDAFLKGLEKSPEAACGFLQIQHHSTLVKLNGIAAGEPTDENLKTLEKFNEISDRLARACDKVLQEENTGGGQAPESSEGDSQLPPDDGIPHNLTPPEKACWPLCQEPWGALNSGIEGLKLRLERVKKAVNEAAEAAKLLGTAQQRLRNAERELEALKQFQGSRRVDAAADAKLKAANKARADAGSDVLTWEAEAARTRAAAEQANADLSTWVAEVASRQIAYEQCLARCAASAREQKVGMGPGKWALIGGGLAAGGVALAASGSSTNTAAAPAAAAPATPPPAVDYRVGSFGAVLQVDQNAARHPNLLPTDIFNLLITKAKA